jgi:hypothetical protein
MRAKSILLLSLFVGTALYSCTTDSYEKGEGEYSRMEADFVEAHANADKRFDYVDTDDGERLLLSQPYERSWIKTPDSLYRAILYYKRAEKTVDPVTMAQVSVATIVRTDSLEKRMKSRVKTDPLTLESVWISKSKRYLNASVYLKVGSTDNKDAIHKMGIVCDTIMTHADNTRTLHLRLYHDQGGVPEYYSQRTYFSLPLSDLKADSIRFTVNTYKGEVVRMFKIK